MHWYNFFLEQCFLLSILLPQIYTRKYDIEAEAMRLYGENLQAVLHRFRRSPEYLKLLDDKSTEMAHHQVNVINHSMQYITEKLEKRIADFCGYKPDVATSAIPIARYLKPYGGARRDDEEDEKARLQNLLNGIFPPPVELLDTYYIFSSHLSTKERNKIRDMAFEAIGQVIHMSIRGMGPMDYRSTRQPFANEGLVVSTERDHRHVISSTKGHYEEMDESTTYRPTSAEHSPIDDTLGSLNS